MRATKRVDGTTAYHWKLPPWERPARDTDGKLVPAVRDGRRNTLANTSLGADLAAAIAKADASNEALVQWRTGERGTTIVKGTVEWLFAWCREQERYKKNVAETRRDYRKLMDMLAAFETKAGAPPLGKRMANKVDAGVADKLYRSCASAASARQPTPCRFAGWSGLGPLATTAPRA